jgi:hypothetical protein|tara:strand:- start:974 stop:1348 length:375 start_codon:yes stop_codon:yes gene_type:complete
LATPVVASLLITIFCIAAGLKVGVGVLQVIFFIILALLVWSYVFTLVLILPIHLASRRKGWSGWIYLNSSAVISTLLIAVIMLVLGQTGERLWILLPILFFGLCNANLTWLLHRRSMAKSLPVT